MLLVVVTNTQTSSAPASYQIAGNVAKCSHSSFFLLSLASAFRQTGFNLIDTLFFLYLQDIQFSNSWLLVLL